MIPIFHTPFILLSSDSLPGMRTSSLMRIGTKEYNKQNYATALMYYEEAAKRGYVEKELFYRLGVSNLKLRRYYEAVQWLQKSLDFDKTCTLPAHYYLAQAYKQLGNYQLARVHIDTFLRCYNGKELMLKEYAAIDTQGIINSINFSDSFKVTRLPSFINTSYSEHSPATWQNKLFYTSLCDNSCLKKAFKDTLNPSSVQQIFFSSMLGDTFSLPVVETGLKLGNYHITSLCFYPRKREIYFSLCYGELYEQQCAIWRAYFEQGMWSDEKELNEKVNYNMYASIHPFMAQTSEGKEILWFSSNRPGGYGGYDIWFCERNKDGRFSAARNAGSVINTARDEVTPFFDEYSNTLFFSSTGWPSFGGMDVYYAQLKNKQFSKAKPLPPPINSSYDETFFRYFERRNGYFASNRPHEDTSHYSTCCDDIFAFYVSPQIRPWLKVTVYDTTGNFLPGASVALLDSSEKVLIDTLGSTLLSLLPANGNYIVKVSHTNYLPVQKKFDVLAFSSADTAEVAVLLKPMQFNKP
ncbi:MAG: tetratricopeptide repeat protein, partial [Chitinophagales bacterium]|nr:tetratricopeptide repeat protein [Chitinophagales bacterium]